MKWLQALEINSSKQDESKKWSHDIMYYINNIIIMDKKCSA